MNKRDRITQAAKEFLAAEPAGLKYSALIGRLRTRFPEENPDSGNFRGAVWNLDARFPDEIYKPARGLFRLVRFREAAVTPGQVGPAPQATPDLREYSFYEPFVTFLVEELEECTKAVALGGNRFGGKWGTP